MPGVEESKRRRRCGHQAAFGRTGLVTGPFGCAGLVTAAIALVLGLSGGGPAWAQQPAGDSPGPLQTARERVAAHPQDAEAHLALGHALFDRERLQAALASFARAVALEPDNLEALVNVGVLHLETGHPTLALPVLTSAREIAPADPLLLCNLARAHGALGETAAAVDCLVAALEADPDSQPAHFHLGVLFAEAGIYAEAQREFEAVVAADPRSSAADQARVNLSRLRRMIQEEAQEDRDAQPHTGD